MNEINFEELKQAAEPLLELLREKGNPYTMIVVTQRDIKVLEDKQGIPCEYED